MSISAISASTSPYSYSSTTSKKKQTSADDAMSQAITQLQSTDPTLASKLSDMQKKVDSMKKSGASEKDVQSTIKSTMDGLSDTEKGELKSAMPAPPAGGTPGAGGHHHHRKAQEDSSATGSSASTVTASSLLDTASAVQNDSVMNMLAGQSEAALAE